MYLINECIRAKKFIVKKVFPEMTQWVRDNDFINKVLFVPPSPSYMRADFPNQLVWLGTKGNRFPCLTLFPLNCQVQYVIIYLHGNGCDLGGMHQLLRVIMLRLQVGVIAPEYPGYGLSEASTPCESSVKKCSKLTLEFVVNTLKIPLSRVIIFGTSIGTGGACWLAKKILEKKRRLGALILQSPFTSIKAIIREVRIFESPTVNFFAQVGSTFIADRFMNLQVMKGVESPLLVLHGAVDDLIPSSHSKIIFDSSAADVKQLVIFPGVGHNDFDWNAVIKKVRGFLIKVSQYYRHERKIAVRTNTRKLKALQRGPSGNIEKLAMERASSSAKISTVIGSTVGTVIGSAIGVAQSLTPESKEEPAQSLSEKHVIVQGNLDDLDVDRNSARNSQTWIFTSLPEPVQRPHPSTKQQSPKLS